MKWKLLLILLLIIPVVFGAVSNPTEPQVTDKNTFTLQVNFSEPVEILHGDTYLQPETTATGISPDRIWDATGERIIYNFKFGESPDEIPVGDYMFFTKYKLPNNDALWSYNIEVIVTPPPPPSFDINIKNPKYGYYNGYPPFDLTVNTSRAAKCRWDYNIDGSSISYTSMKLTTPSNGDSDHTFEIISTSRYKDYLITCIDLERPEDIVSEVFTFGYFQGANEVISVVQVPEVVEDNRIPFADVIITLNDSAYCELYDSNRFHPDFIPFDEFQNNFESKLGDASLHKTQHTLRACFSKDYCVDEDYKVTGAFDVNDADMYEFQTPILCANLAETLTYGVVYLKLNWSDDPRVILSRPNDYETTTEVPISMTSILVLGACNYELSQADTVIQQGALARINDRNFTSIIPLTDGEYSVTVTCSGAFSEDEVRTTDFVVDTVIPSNLLATVPRNICMNGTLETNYSATDVTSGIDHFSYEITKNNAAIFSGTKTELTLSIPFNQPLGSYKFEIKATDKAGLETSTVKYDFDVKSSDDVSCDYTNPDVDVGSRTEDGDILWWVLCDDTQSGCEDNFKYNLYPGTRESSAVCTYNKTGDINKIYELDYQSILCYNVSDNANNVVTGTYKLEIGDDGEGDPLPHCRNDVRDEDETDVDCGGSCDYCDDGDICEGDSDCESAYCNSEDICEELECDDDDDCNDGSFCNNRDICERYELDELCSDNRRNGDETDTDCGGSCDACEEGDTCDVDDDCETLYCSTDDECELQDCDEDDDCEDEQFCSSDNTCLNEDDYSSHCSNDREDRDETDVDCGGDDCDYCNFGDDCESDNDCITDICSEDNECVEVACVVDTDCEIGQICTDDLTCRRGRSNNPTHCTNNEKDGDETGTDCGGSCRDCSTNDACASNADCDSGYCSSSKVCEPSPYECIYNWDCDGDEICNAQFLCQQSTARTQDPDDTEAPLAFLPEEPEGIALASIILIIFGVLLIGGGGYMYFVPPTTTPKSGQSSPKINDATSSPTQIDLGKRKSLDYDDIKKVKELRNKLSKKKAGKLRKNLMSEFDSKVSTDKEIPPGVERLKKDLIPPLKKKKGAKPIPKLAKRITKKATKKSEEYIPIEQLTKKKKKKKKTMFDELDKI